MNREDLQQLSKGGFDTKAPLPDVAQGSPFGAGIASLVVYLKSFQLFSYQWLQAFFKDVLGPSGAGYSTRA